MQADNNIRISRLKEIPWTDCILPGQSIDFLIFIHQNTMLLFKCFCFFVYINECIDVNTAFLKIPTNL